MNSPQNSIPCHTVFCQIRLHVFHRGKFGSSLGLEPVQQPGNLDVEKFLRMNNILFNSNCISVPKMQLQVIPSHVVMKSGKTEEVKIVNDSIV